MTVIPEEISAPTFTVGLDGFKAERKMRVTNWSDLEEYLDDLISTQFAAGNINIAEVTRFPGKDHLIFNRARVKPFTDSVGANDPNGVATCPEGAEIVLEYAVPGFGNADKPDEHDDDPDLPDVPLLEHKVRSSIQMVTHSNSAMAWAVADADGKTTLPEDFETGVPTVIMDHTLTWHRVSFPPWTAIRNTLGRLNNAAFLGHGIGTVMFTGADMDRNIKFTEGNIETRHWTITYTFKARIVDNAEPTVEVTWNHFLQPNPVGLFGAWISVVDGAGNSLFQSADFNGLFVAETPS